MSCKTDWIWSSPRHAKLELRLFLDIQRVTLILIRKTQGGIKTLKEEVMVMSIWC